MPVGSQRILRVSGFTGVDEHHVQDAAAMSYLQDARWDDRGGWETCGGIAKILLDNQGVDPFTGQGEVTSMFWYSIHNGVPQRFLWEMGSKLVYFDGPGRSWIELATNRFTTDMPWQRTQYAQMGNDVWIVNGVNEPLRFDGRDTYAAGFRGPAPTVTAECVSESFIVGTVALNALGLGTAATETTDGGGEYGYLMTEVNAKGTESPPSAAPSVIRWRIQKPTASVTNTQPRYFAKLSIPSSNNDDVVGRWVYRTVNSYGSGLQDGARYYRVAFIPGNHECTHVDSRSDAYFGRELDFNEVGPWPVSAKYACVYKGRMFLAGMTDDPDIVVWSRADQPESFPAVNYLPLAGGDGPVTGMRVFRNMLIVTRERGIYMVMLSDQDNFTVKMLERSVGCRSSNSIRDVPGLGLTFVADDGVRLLTGSIQAGDNAAATTLLSDELADYWRWRVNKSALANAWSQVYHADRELWVSIPIDGQPRNRMVLVYHYGVPGGAWSFRPDLNVACMAETSDRRGYLFLGSNDDTAHPGVYVYSLGFADKDGVAKAFTMKSAQLDLAGIYAHPSLIRVTVRMLTYGTNTLSLTPYKDRRPEVAQTAQTRKQIDVDYRDVGTAYGSNAIALPVWDTALWSATSTETWMQAVPTTVAWDISTGGAKEAQFVLSTTARAQILGCEFHVNAQGTRSVDTYNPVIGTGTE